MGDKMFKSLTVPAIWVAVYAAGAVADSPLNWGATEAPLTFEQRWEAVEDLPAMLDMTLIRTKVKGEFYCDRKRCNIV